MNPEVKHGLGQFITACIVTAFILGFGASLGLGLLELSVDGSSSRGWMLLGVSALLFAGLCTIVIVNGGKPDDSA